MQKMLCALAAMLLASCSSDWSAGLADQRTAPSTSQPRQHSAPGKPFAASVPLRPRSFANAPDRGSLVQYPNSPVVRRSGAYTWHAAELSEDHALKSTITGDLSFTAPDGTAISLKYERHVEHPDGNWSWIGRGSDERAESTVITFGDDAAFGTIPQRDGPPLRLTVSAGRSWVVATDPRLLRDVNNEATDPTGPDYLVPPKLSVASTASGIEAMAAEAASTTSGGKTVVDVLVGFTNGYSDHLGGASAALTRVHNLVDITNQAYVNSKVEAEVRLVHAMQIGYPDATDNGTALEELTGFKAPSTKTTPAAAFSGLRSARDQYGADLVVLLRRFQDPENDGCGIAWLIGGGQSGIASSDEYFGYSVVSDGQDTGTDGKTYFCRDETFAHELGHNMGSQHDSENAKKDDGSLSFGAYSYSFGYKTAATDGGFYTVMAYGDKGQTRNRVFSSPKVSICGIDANLVCGVVDQADNARSLGQTTPLVEGFRTAVVPLPSPTPRARNDIDGDGKSDIILHRANQLVYWVMNGPAIIRSRAFTVPVGYRLVATGDFDGNNRLDVAWVTDSNAVYLWLGDGSTFTSHFVYRPSTAYKIVGVVDLDADGNSDLLLHKQGQIVQWMMNGASIARSRYFAVDPSWVVQAVGDFDANGFGDMVWANGSSEIYMWLGNASAFGSHFVIRMNAQYIIAGVGDVDANGTTDLLLHKQGQLVHWMMDGAALVRSRAFSINTGWQVESVGDFDGSTYADIVWIDGNRNQIMGSWNGSSSYINKLLPTLRTGYTLAP